MHSEFSTAASQNLELKTLKKKTKNGFDTFKNEIYRKTKLISKHKTKIKKGKLKTLVLKSDGKEAKNDSQQNFTLASSPSTVLHDSDDGVWSSDSFDMPKHKQP